MGEEQEVKKDNTLWIILGVAIGLCSVIVGVFMYFVWWRGGIPYSTDPEAWAYFATYFGNMATPILTVGAVGVAYKQLKHSQNLHQETMSNNLYEHLFHKYEKDLNEIEHYLKSDINNIPEIFKHPNSTTEQSKLFCLYHNSKEQVQRIAHNTTSFQAKFSKLEALRNKKNITPDLYEKISDKLDSTSITFQDLISDLTDSFKTIKERSSPDSYDKKLFNRAIDSFNYFSINKD